MQPWIWVLIAVALVLALVVLFRRPAGRGADGGSTVTGPDDAPGSAPDDVP
jgi:preprotein translocase subunit SecG